MFLWVGGSQTAAAYSIVGWTKVVNARLLADWEELRLRRARIMTILLFKIVNNLVDIPPEPFLIPTGAITREHNVRLLQPHTRTITFVSKTSI
jgi:hypothetical protein